MEPLLVSINEAAKALNLGRTSIYELISQEKLDTRKMGRRRLITVASIKRLAEEQD
ncbi:MAG: helix-turn-helix domain-containing protein [Erythrobacter sp.]